MPSKLISKVLVLDNAPQHAERIKQFCEENNLVALKVRKNRLLSVLRSNIDLGAILYAESYGSNPEETAEIALRIHTLRPELPIILRREESTSLEDVHESMRPVFCGAYCAGDMSALARLIGDYLFSQVYPNDLVRGILEITENTLSRQFGSLTAHRDTPYLVRDHMIFGEVFSLIPLESNWCRGYMMLQTEEGAILEILNREGASPEAGFRDVNNLLGELTNLIWGAFRNRYIGDAMAISGHQVQVPLIVNHKHKYISFGTQNPQLCFLYTLNDETTGACIRIYQRFIFNLCWSPEDFREIDRDSAPFVTSGELELF